MNGARRLRATTSEPTSSPPGAGSTGAPAHAGWAGGVSAEGEAPINILIVDDEPKNLTVLETILDDPRYRLVRAESADEALLALVAERFALLILDIRMPGMTGFELAEVIKQRKKTAHVPIIFLTAYYNEDQHVLEGYESGAVDYLHKPVNPRILRSKVAVFAELHRKSMEATNANRALTTEVTERRRAEQQLREINDTLEQRVADRTEELQHANRVKDEFLAMLSHELRNPLSAISNAIQMIDPSGGAADRTSWALSLIDRQAKNLRRIVDDLLDVVRITRGKIELRGAPVDLSTIVGQAVDAVRPFVRSEELEVVLPVDEPLRVNADFTRLEQVLVNLLLNAIKFASEGRRIRIVVERADADAIVSIVDNGIGIAPEMLPRIFELFTQADASLDRIRGGLGIGLFICRRLIELHGGRIMAHSDGVGRGATFTVRLPMLREAEAVVPPGGDTPSHSVEAKARRVLIVDDNVDSAVALSWLIGHEGYDVRVAHDGPAALDAAQDFKPEILLLDIGLPGIDGYEVARRLRADGFASARMIAISGYARESDVELSRAAGFDRHFAKPVLLADLVAAFE
jgi:signal transduction histidine kinase